MERSLSFYSVLHEKNFLEFLYNSELYKKARAGELKGFTGIDSAYEPPENPDLLLESGTESETESVRKVLEFLYQKVTY